MEKVLKKLKNIVISFILINMFSLYSARAFEWDHDLRLETESDIHEMVEMYMLDAEKGEGLVKLLKNPLDINKMDQEECFSLPGISYGLCGKIISERKKKGKLNAWDFIEIVPRETTKKISPFIEMEGDGWFSLEPLSYYYWKEVRETKKTQSEKEQCSYYHLFPYQLPPEASLGLKFCSCLDGIKYECRYKGSGRYYILNWSEIDSDEEVKKICQRARERTKEKKRPVKERIKKVGTLPGLKEEKVGLALVCEDKRAALIYKCCRKLK